MEFEAAALWREQPESAKLDAIRGIREWAENDIRAAISWAHQIQDDDAWDALSSAICFHVSQHSPKDALDVLAEFRLDARSCELAGAILSCWAEKDHGGALNWVTQYGDPSSHDQLLASVLKALACRDPAGAAASLHQMAPGSIQDETLCAIIDGWASSDLAAADYWVRSMASNALREKALERIQAAHVREQTILEDQPDLR